MHGHPRSSRSLGLLAVLALAAVLPACSTETDRAADAVRSTSSATPMGPTVAPPPAPPAAGADPIVLPSAHVHAIARDPGSGALLVAAHDGLYTYDGATPERVGPVLDLMGFAVAGPDHYYASGHPGTEVDMPQPLGLIETRDGGRTWSVLSRGGESDFHALTVTDRAVVGFDGTVRTTADGRTWTEGGLGLEPRSLAGAREGSTLLATTAAGLMRSTDGGGSWREVNQWPRLLMAAFGDGGAVAGLTPDGQLHTSDDGGQTWRATELLAPGAHALHVSGEGQDLEVLVASGQEVLVSRGGGPFEALR